MLNVRLSLNKHLRHYTFKVVTHRQVLTSIHQRDRFTMEDLKDVFFHIAIFEARRQ